MNHNSAILLFELLPFVSFDFEFFVQAIITNYKSCHLEPSKTDRILWGEEQFRIKALKKAGVAFVKGANERNESFEK